MDNQVIDQVNIYEATKLAMQEAISQLSPQPEHLLIDAMKLDLPISQTSIIKGDANSLSIAAASIVAKVTRDELMKESTSSSLAMISLLMQDMEQLNTWKDSKN